MSEDHKLKSSTGISYSADPVLRVEQSIRSEIAAVSPFVDELMFFIKTSRCVPGREIDVEVSLREAWFGEFGMAAPTWVKWSLMVRQVISNF
jgi:hypothetical protein